MSKTSAIREELAKAKSMREDVLCEEEKHEYAFTMGYFHLHTSVRLAANAQSDKSLENSLAGVGLMWET